MVYVPKQRVRVVRYIDGHWIENVHENLTAHEVMVLHVEEECLPGKLVVFSAVPMPRPWETGDTTT